MSIDRYSSGERKDKLTSDAQPPQSFGQPEVNDDPAHPDHHLPAIECPEQLRAIVDSAHGVRIITSLPPEVATNRKDTYFPSATFKYEGWQRKTAPKLRTLGVCEVLAFMPATEITTKTWEALKEEPMKGLLGRLGLKTYVDFSEIKVHETPYVIGEEKEEGMHVDYMFVPEYSRDPNLIYDYTDAAGRGNRTLHIQTFLPRSLAQRLWMAVRDDRQAARRFAEQLFLKSDLPRALWDSVDNPIRPPYENLQPNHQLGIVKPTPQEGVDLYVVESVDF